MSLSEFFPSLGFIGAGNMAGAIVRAVAGRRLIAPAKILVCDALPEKAQALAAELGVKAIDNNRELTGRCTNVVLAVKPQDLLDALAAIRDAVTPNHRIVSIAAGMPTHAIEAALPAGARVVRVMPNTPALVGAGAAAVAAGAHASPDDVKAVCKLFEAVGAAEVVDEDAMDAVTALSGSGPAYVFRLMEIVQAAGEEMGLDAKLARRLTLQTFLGAARLACESGDPPSVLRERVTSPGGTTAAALKVFEEKGLEAAIREGLKAARDRSIELAREQ